MDNIEALIANLEYLLADIDKYSIEGAAKARHYEILGRVVSSKRKQLLAALKENTDADL